MTGPGRSLTSEWRQSQRGRQIVPVRILTLDQVDLPLPMPALKLLLAGNRVVHAFELLEMDQHVHAVSGGETLHLIGPVLIQTGHWVRCHADVQRTMGFAGEDIDDWLFHGRCGCGRMDAETSSA
jgi:hypothetical protein